MPIVALQAEARPSTNPATSAGFVFGIDIPGRIEISNLDVWLLVGMYTKSRVEHFHDVARRAAFDPIPDRLAITPPGDEPVFAQERQVL